MDRFDGAFEIKTVDSDQRIISGWAAYHSTIDRTDDIIDPSASQKAVARLKNLGDVDVYIAHEYKAIPIGIPVRIEARERGLYTETFIFEGPDGDQLLGAAKGLLARGSSLGQSIGYRIPPGGARFQRSGAKTVRHIGDYELREYSFASKNLIAHPDALVTNVKTSGGAMTYMVKPMGDKFAVMKDGESLASYDTEDAAQARCDALNKPDGGKTVHPNQLPDANFLYVAPGGVLDDEGKTVPRTNRHFAFRGADGTLDSEALAVALKAIPESKTLGLSEKALSGLETKARAFLESAGGTERKTVDVGAPEWREGSPLSLRGLGYRVLDLSEKLATDHAAMLVLGDDTKSGERMRPETRVKVRELAQQLTDLVDRAEYVDGKEDGAADIAQRRRHLQLTEVGLW